MKSTLTPRQRELLDFLKAHERVPPSYRDIMRELGYKSTGNVAQVIAQLEKRGHLHKPKGMVRCYVFK